MADNGNTTISILEVEALYNNLKLVQDKVNKACQAGVYTIDDAYLLKVSFDNLNKSIKTLDEYQQLILKMSAQQEALKAKEGAPVEDTGAGVGTGA